MWLSVVFLCHRLNSYWGGWCGLQVLRPGGPSWSMPASHDVPTCRLATTLLSGHVFTAAQPGANDLLLPPCFHQLLQELLLLWERERWQDGALQQSAAHRDPPGYPQWHTTRLPGLQPLHYSPNECFCRFAPLGGTGSITQWIKPVRTRGIQRPGLLTTVPGPFF